MLFTFAGLVAAFRVASCCGPPFMLATLGLGTAWLGGFSLFAAGLPQSVWLLWRSAGPRRITCPDGNAGSLMSDENQLRLGAGTGPTDLGR